MRIAMVSAHASPHIAELAVALARRGHDIRVYTRKDRARQSRGAELDRAVRVEHVPAGPPKVLPSDELLPYMPDFGRCLAERWTARGWVPDVVHAHFWTGGLAALTATRESGIPVVQTYHELGSIARRHQGDGDTGPDNRIALERALAQAVNRVVAQCGDELFELIRLGVPRRSVSLVPSGVDLDRFTPSGPAAARGRQHRVLSVGRLVERKGFAELIRALKLVPDAELVIAGGPPRARLGRDPQARRLLESAASADVADRVTLLGAVPRADMPALYRSADLLACAPWYEPFGLSPLEAMACGVPVVATAVGGLKESVIDGVTGVLVPPGDIEALGTTIRRLLGDEIRRWSYGSASLDRVRSRYSWDRTAAELVRVYREIRTGPAGERSGRPWSGVDQL